MRRVCFLVENNCNVLQSIPYPKRHNSYIKLLLYIICHEILPITSMQYSTGSKWKSLSSVPKRNTIEVTFFKSIHQQKRISTQQCQRHKGSWKMNEAKRWNQRQPNIKINILIFENELGYHLSSRFWSMHQERDESIKEKMLR